MKSRLFLIGALLFCTVGFTQSVNETLTKANQYYRQDQFELAERLYRFALRTDPNNVTAQRNLSNALYRQKKYDEALSVLNNLSQKKMDKNIRAMAYYNSGVINSRQKDLEGSIENYKNALRLNPDDKDARENLQKALLELKQKQQQQQKEQQRKSQSNMSQKEAERKLNELQEKEKQIQQRIQNQQGGVPMPNDW